MNSNTFQRIYEIVEQIPCGRVTTYGQIGRLLGNPHMSRVVGYALNSCRQSNVPCHRVVNRRGELSKAFEATVGVNEQGLLLAEEGVKLTLDGRVDLSQYMWYGF